MITRPTDEYRDVTPDRASLETARRIHEVCQRFEADWRRADQVAKESARVGADDEASAVLPRPQLQSYLAGVAEPQRSSLLAELLAIDLELRSTLMGQQPTPADYVDLFPDDASLIAEVFRQSSWSVRQSADPGRGCPSQRTRSTQNRRLRDPGRDRPRGHGSRLQSARFTAQTAGRFEDDLGRPACFGRPSHSLSLRGRDGRSFAASGHRPDL